MPKVFVEPIGITLTVDEQENLLDGLVRAQIDIPTDCAGRGTCGKCLVRLGVGRAHGADGARAQADPREAARRGLAPGLPGVPPLGARQHRGARHGRAASHPHHVQADARRRASGGLHAVRAAEPPTLADKRSDLERLDEGLGGVEVPLHVLQELPATLRDGKWKVTATCYGKRVIDVHPGERDRECYGVAVDIGTSKVIAYLFDLRRGTLIDQEAVENPQMRYGEDVISRIAHAAQTSETALLPPPCARGSTRTSRRSTSARTSTPTTSAT